MKKIIFILAIVFPAFVFSHDSLIVLEIEDQVTNYSRRAWRHWIDADKNCRDTRQEVLIEEGKNIKMDDKGCKVISGEWVDLYTGKTFTDPSKLDIDHFIPLSNVHFSQGYRWSKDKRKAYANALTNPNHLIAVSASANRSKGKKSPDQWMPPNKKYHCEYIKIWVDIKHKWDLSVTQAEYDFINAKLKECN